MAYKFNSIQWTDKVISAKQKSAMPIVTYPGLALTNQLVIDIVTNGKEQAKCVEAVAQHFQALAGVMIMDLSVEAEAFGAQIDFKPTEIPTVNSRLLSNSEAIEKLRVPAIGQGRTSEYLKAAALACGLVAYKPILGGIIGPYSLAGRLFDITEMMTLILIEPDKAHLLLEKCTSFLIEYAKQYKANGVAGIIIAEPAAGLLSPKACEEFSSVYVKKIVDAVQDNSFMVILHNCGNTAPLVQSMLGTHAMGLHFGNAVNMADILPQIPENILAFGNIDPSGVLKFATPDIVYNNTLELLEETKNYKHFVLSSGCDIPPGTPLENIDAFFKALEFFNSNQ